MKLLQSLLPLVGAVVASQDAQVPFTPSDSPAQGLTLDALPLLGFGTWNLKEKNTSEAVSWAIQIGYRHIDCAAAYSNEEEVGKGIEDGLQRTGLKREDLWITSKLWNDHHAPGQVEEGIDTSLKKLGVGYLDLYHMHWPVASDSDGYKSIYYRDTWAAMAVLQKKGKARHIGISNFDPEQLNDLLNHTDVRPAVHQMELHPYLQQNEWIDWHRERGIHVTAYSPLGGTNPTYKEGDKPEPLLKSKAIAKIAKKRGCTPAQVVIQWGLARGTSLIPKSIHADHIKENFHSVECVLKKKDLKKIDKLGKWHHRYNNPSKSWGVPLYNGLEDNDGKHKAAKWFSHE